MLRSYIASDIYRVLLGASRQDLLGHVLDDYRLPVEGAPRQMRRDDGTGVWVANVLIDGDTLQRLSLLNQVFAMQVDNVSARLRVSPSLPGDAFGGSRFRAA